MITNFPSQLGVDDIEDFCTLAQYYATRTPQSYRKVIERCFRNTLTLTTIKFVTSPTQCCDVVMSKHQPNASLGNPQRWL